MYQDYCKKCGSVSLHTKKKGNHIGLYCEDCGAWLTWLSKDDAKLFERQQKERNESSSDVKDGVYAELFVVKNGVKSRTCIVDVKDISALLTDTFVSTIEKFCAD